MLPPLLMAALFAALALGDDALVKPPTDVPKAADPRWLSGTGRSSASSTTS